MMKNRMTRISSITGYVLVLVLLIMSTAGAQAPSAKNKGNKGTKSQLTTSAAKSPGTSFPQEVEAIKSQLNDLVVDLKTVRSSLEELEPAKDGRIVLDKNRMFEDVNEFIGLIEGKGGIQELIDRLSKRMDYEKKLSEKDEQIGKLKEKLAQAAKLSGPSAALGLRVTQADASLKTRDKAAVAVRTKQENQIEQIKLRVESITDYLGLPGEKLSVGSDGLPPTTEQKSTLAQALRIAVKHGLSSAESSWKVSSIWVVLVVVLFVLTIVCVLVILTMFWKLPRIEEAVSKPEGRFENQTNRMLGELQKTVGAMAYRQSSQMEHLASAAQRMEESSTELAQRLSRPALPERGEPGGVELAETRERLTGMEQYLEGIDGRLNELGEKLAASRDTEVVERIASEVSGIVQHGLTIWLGEAGTVLKKLEKLDRIATRLNPRLKHFREDMKTYYAGLLSQISGKEHAKDNLPKEPHFRRLVGLRDCIRNLSNSHPRELGNLLESYLKELNTVVTVNTVGPRLQAAVSNFIDSWNDGRLMEIRLEADREKLARPEDAAGFVEDVFPYWEKNKAAIEACEKEVRKLIASQATPGADYSPQAAARKFKEYRRSRISNLIQMLDELVPGEEEIRADVNESIKTMLNLLDLEEIDVQASEELNDSLHEVDEVVQTSEYGDNTIIDVVRRGIRLKGGGDVLSKAVVRVARRPS